MRGWKDCFSNKKSYFLSACTCSYVHVESMLEKVCIYRVCGGKNTCIVVSRKYAPPFAILALVQSAGGAYTRDATFSLAITPPLALPFDHGDLEPDCVGVSTRLGRGVGAECKARGGEMLQTLAVGWRICRTLRYVPLMYSSCSLVLRPPPFLFFSLRSL